MERRSPERTCTGCGAKKEKATLIRIVRMTSEAGEVLYHIDRTGKQNGRGAYLCDDVECLKKAIKKRGLDRSFHTKVPAAVYEALEQELEVRT